MKQWTHRMLLAAAIAVGLFCGTASAQNSPDYAAAESRYETTLDQRGALIEQLERVEDRYRGLIRKIDSLKATGAMSTIGGRIELQNLLTEGKSIADELDRLQEDVRQLDSRLVRQRSTLMSDIDQRIAALEQRLGRASASERRSAVAELNSLRRRRSAYSTPLPQVPSSSEVSSALELAEGAAHPDELMAAADELQDTEDQLRKRLAAIDEKLNELRNARTLVRRARSFSREERFFEETDRDRVIARYDRVTRTPRDGQGSTDDSANEAPPTSANDDGVATDANNDSGFSDGAAGAPEPSMDSDLSGGESQREEPTISDSPTGAPVAEGPPATQDPFETSRERIVIDGGGDPSRSVGSIGRSGSSLDGQIDRLEKEQKKLKEQAGDLRKRARQLRKRAEDM